MRAILFSVTFLLLASPITVAQDINPFGDGNELPPQILERLNQKKKEAQNGPKEENADSDDDKKAIDDFFKELEEVLNGQDKRSIAIKAVLSELKQEYRELELQLEETPHDTAMQDRQKIIAQYHQNLAARNKADPSNMHEVMSTISDRIRNFRRENPKLAQRAEFRAAEREIRNRAMQGNRFGGRSHRLPSLKETMKTLSATGKVVDRWAPQRLRAHPGEARGALQDFHFTMRRLLRLQWEGDKLSLARNHWDAAFAGQTPGDIQTDVDHLLEKRGVKPYVNDNERQRWQQMAQRGIGVETSLLANVGRLFQEFYVDGSRSYSGGGSSGRWTAQTTDVSVRLDANLTNFTLSFEELNYPGRLIRFRSAGDSLSLTVLGDFIHRFQQRVDPNGNATLQITEILDDEVLNYEAPSFAALYTQRPRYVEERFLPLLEHIGIVPPHSRFDPSIVKRVVELLTGDRAAIQARFDAIAQDLDVNQFTKREAAYRQLRENLDEFFPLLYAKSKDETLSREARARIAKLLEIGNQQGTAELDSTITALGLTSDAEYLSELVEIVAGEDRSTVKAHLKSLDSR